MLAPRHQGPGSRGADGAYAHPTLFVLTQLWGHFFANKSTYNSTSVQHLYCCMLICFPKKFSL